MTGGVPMWPRTRRRRSGRSGGDEGYAMLTAVALMAISALIVASMLAYTLREVRQTGQLRQRGAAISAAEGQVDSMVNRISRSVGAPSNLPCTASATDTTTKPDVIQIATTVTYYDAAGAALGCPITSGDPVKAVVRSVATGQSLGTVRPARRVMEAVLQLAAPSVGLQLDKAIFSNSSMTVANQATVSGSSAGADADIHTNGSFTCRNRQSFYGSVTARGSISMSNSCFIAGDAWARTGFSTGNPSDTVGGGVLVSGGSAVLNNNSSVSGQIKASGSITWSKCNPTKCLPGASLPEPPYEPFPRLDWNAATQAAWYDGGFTQVVTNNDCTVVNGKNGPARWLVENTSSLTVPTILRTSCALILDHNGDQIRLGKDVAVFADGGVFLTSNADVTSTDSSARHLYLVQPYSAAPDPCTVDGIVIRNRVVLDTMVNMLLYSPCVVRKANLSTLTGQVYSGASVSLDNQLDMIYEPLPVYGVTDASGNTQQWKSGLLAKRESH